MGKSIPKAPAESVALYEALLATNPEIERKGATMPYTSINGSLFSLLSADGTLALRLPAKDTCKERQARSPKGRKVIRARVHHQDHNPR